LAFPPKGGGVFEFLREAVSPANLPFTVLMGLVTFYWALVGLGALDFHSEPGLEIGHGHGLHLEDGLHAHGPADLHPPAEMHHDVAHAIHGVPGAVKAALQFMNFGNVPAMIVVSVFALSLWTFSMIGNHYFNQGALQRAALLLVPNLIVTVLITKVATTPLKHLFTALNREYEEHQPVVGRTCTIITSEVTERFGQAQVETSGAPIIINVRSFDNAIFSKGEMALIIKEDKENQLFTVAKLTLAAHPQETTL
jgi:hypothetical protein